MININKEEIEATITEINEQMRIKGESIERTKTEMEAIEYDTK